MCNLPQKIMTWLIQFLYELFFFFFFKFLENEKKKKIELNNMNLKIELVKFVFCNNC